MYSEHHSAETVDHSHLPDFKETTRPEGPMPPEGWGVFALDCEMYFSSRGIEVGRVSVVDVDLRCVFDAYIANSLPVSNYITR